MRTAIIVPVERELDSAAQVRISRHIERRLDYRVEPARPVVSFLFRDGRFVAQTEVHREVGLELNVMLVESGVGLVGPRSSRIGLIVAGPPPKQERRDAVALQGI